MFIENSETDDLHLVSARHPKGSAVEAGYALEICLDNQQKYKNSQLSLCLGLPVSKVFQVVPDPKEKVHLATCLTEGRTEDPVPDHSGPLTMK